jgi:hypothetical protein
MYTLGKIHGTMHLSIVVDGALASRFLADLQKAIERPGIML